MIIKKDVIESINLLFAENVNFIKCANTNKDNEITNKYLLYRHISNLIRIYSWNDQKIPENKCEEIKVGFL